MPYQMLVPIAMTHFTLIKPKAIAHFHNKPNAISLNKTRWRN